MKAEIEAVILREDETISGTCPTALVRFPANRYELADALDRARVSERHPGYTMINIKCRMPGLAALLAQSGATLETLNLLASRLSELTQEKRMAYEAMLKIDHHAKTIGNLVNLTYNLGGCTCAEPCDDRHLGKFLVSNGLVPELDGVPDRVLRWLDYARLGAEHRKAEHGVFVRSGYAVNDSTEWNPVFPQDLLPRDVPKLDEPIDGVIRVFAQRKDTGNGVWLDLPMDCFEMLRRIGAVNPDDCLFLYAYSSILPLNKLLSPQEDLTRLNDVAGILAGITEPLKFKASLIYEDCETLYDAAYMAEGRMGLNEFYSELVTPEDYGKWLVVQRTGTPPDDPSLEMEQLSQYGQMMMEQHQARCTPYGIVRRL